MRILITSLFLMFSVGSFGQLFPKLPEFRGNVEKVTEKQYGKEQIPTKKDSSVFKPGKYSGWKYTFLFDENSKLKSRKNSFRNNVLTEYTYQRNKIGDRNIEREIIERDNEGHAGDFVEYENFVDLDGRITKVNYWVGNHQKQTRELFMIEMNAVYKEGKLISFTRHNVNDAGVMDSGERCELFYDSANRIVRIERKDIESDLKTELSYSLNPNGFLDHYSIDLLVGLPVYGKNLTQNIYYKCDSHGNWVKKYTLADQEMIIEAKRKIKYK